MKRTKLEKRLIAASSLGFCIIISNGKRWIYQMPVPRLDFKKECEEKDVMVICEGIDGGVYECLNIIDNALKLLLRQSLTEYYNDRIEEKFDIAPSNQKRLNESVKQMPVGQGGLF